MILSRGNVKMYDHITITDSAKISRIIFAYSDIDPQDGIRMSEYLAEKEYGKFTLTNVTTSGDTKTETISEQDFFFAFGKALGTISKNIPGNR